MSQMLDDSAEQARLGTHLRRTRTDRGWSLTELAALSGVSRAMINRIERGVSSPTATVLGRLSGAFGLTISELLDDRAPSSGPALERAADADTWTDPETGYGRRSLSSPTFPADVTEVSLPAGQEVSYPPSAYAFVRHCIWVIDGVLSLIIGGTTVTLARGDRIELGAPTRVTYRNAATSAVRYLVVVVRTR